MLAHELRHALQDQYVDVHHAVPDSVGDFDDRRVAFMGLLEGDATLVMERFLMQRLGVPATTAPVDLGAAGLRDPGARRRARRCCATSSSCPYLAGRDFVRALHERGGWPALRKAWSDPPRSTEQVLHPEKYFARRGAAARSRGRPRPPGGRAHPGRRAGRGADAHAARRGQRARPPRAGAATCYQVWDVGGRTLLVWRTEWDTAADAREFQEAAVRAVHAQPRAARGGCTARDSSGARPGTSAIAARGRAGHAGGGGRRRRCSRAALKGGVR